MLAANAVQHVIRAGKQREGFVMQSSNLIIVTLLAGLVLAPCVQALPNIAVNGLVSAELAPPSGSSKSDSESGENSECLVQFHIF